MHLGFIVAQCEWPEPESTFEGREVPSLHVLLDRTESNIGAEVGMVR
jgi:hypothetical protein